MVIPTFALALSTVFGADPAAPVPPVPEIVDLCGAPDEQAIRKRVVDAMERERARPKKKLDLANPLLFSGPLVPCAHGVVRLVRFTLGQQEVMVFVEEDRRPSYISGGSMFRSFALIGARLVGNRESLWRTLHKKKDLSQRETAHLLVGLVLLQMDVDVVLDESQRQALVKRWPETAKAVAQSPPGLSLDDAGHLVLQAWTTNGYHERGVHCRYLRGWRATFDGKPKVLRIADYGVGQNMGRPCGRELPQ